MTMRDAETAFDTSAKVACDDVTGASPRTIPVEAGVMNRPTLPDRQFG
jgi:hypothetical protein